MKTRTFKDTIYRELATIVKAMGNSHRLEILELLAQRPCPVEYIASNTRTSIANASQHLQVLKKARLVKAEQKGKYSYYSLADDRVFEAWKSLRELGFAQNAEIGKLIRDFRFHRDSLETVSSLDLLQKIQKNEIVLLDVRPEEEYKEGHIASAISVPTEHLVDRLKDLPKDKEIVAYCRGPLCAMADEAVEMLKQHGFDSKRLDDGYPDWMIRGLPVEMEEM